MQVSHRVKPPSTKIFSSVLDHKASHLQDQRRGGGVRSYSVGGARSNRKSPRVWLGRSAIGVVELRSGGNVSARVCRRFLQEGQVGSGPDVTPLTVKLVLLLILRSPGIVEAQEPL
ncbi:hypothetical protein BHE74_00041435 [Ensete ventricosum]|nr:hypothetical protein BHE74_00041435 [Ensete ventricosum]